MTNGAGRDKIRVCLVDDHALIRQALIWLALKVSKGLLKLRDDDFREHELYELLREYGPAVIPISTESREPYEFIQAAGAG